MERLFVYTIDLEPDFMTADAHEVLLDGGRFDRLAEVLLRNRVRPSVFVVGRMLDAGLPVREKFAPLQAEFGLHSWSHKPEAPDSEQEIVEGKKAFERYFGRSPRGYRAPLGYISQAGIRTLAREQFTYDSSVFPSNRPELGFDLRNLPLDAWIYQDEPSIMELPFAAVPRTRTVIAMSFLKLYGMFVYRQLFRWCGMPRLLVFDSHLYDYFVTAAVTGLSRLDWRRYALMRNSRSALDLLQSLFDFVRKRGYRFVTMDEAREIVRASGMLAEPVPTAMLPPRTRGRQASS